MSDDSFFREVNEEIRQDQARALWDRFGTAVLGLAALVVIGTGAWVGWEYWQSSRANMAGDTFAQALQLAKDGKNDEALAELKKIEAAGHGAYPVLAKLRAATVLAAKGDAKGAVEGFDAVAADGAIPMSIRDLARLRAAYLLVDTGSYADVVQRAEPLAADTNPLRASAREALGLSAWKEGKASDALKLFEQIKNDAEAPQNARQRASLMADLIRSSGVTS